MLIAFCQEWGGFLHKLQLGEAQRKRMAHAARAAGIKVACFVNPEIWMVYTQGSQRSSTIKSYFNYSSILKVLSLRLCQQLLFYNLIFQRIINMHLGLIPWAESWHSALHLHALLCFWQIRRRACNVLPWNCERENSQRTDLQIALPLIVWNLGLWTVRAITAVMFQDEKCGFYGNNCSAWLVLKN